MSDEAPTGNINIAGPYLLFVEGEDEARFFKALLEHMRIGGVQIYNVRGKKRLPSQFSAVHPLLDRVRAYGIVLDADLSVDQTLASIAGVLRTRGEPCPRRNKSFATQAGNPRKVGVFVLPGDADQGMLEDLFLCTVEDHPAMPCVRAYMDCIGKALPRKPPQPDGVEAHSYYPKNPSKATALAFLAAMHEEVHRVGEAAEQHCWDLDHPRLTALRDFLREMASF